METMPADATLPAAPWPLLSAVEVSRLRFLAWRRRMGLIHPPAPVSAEVDALCAALLREPPRPASVGRRSASVGCGSASVARADAYYGGLPPMWRTWAERQKRRSG